MKRYEVEITDVALKDMEELYHHIAFILLSPENAMGQYNRIANAILKLDMMPERYRVIDEYSIFYKIQKDKVIVTNILYSASDIEDRLKR